MLAIEAEAWQIGMRIENHHVAAITAALHDSAQHAKLFTAIAAGLEQAFNERGWKCGPPLTAAECLPFFSNLTESGFRRLATKHGLKKMKWKKEKQPRYLRAEVMRMSKQRYTVAKQISERRGRFHARCLTL